MAATSNAETLEFLWWRLALASLVFIPCVSATLCRGQSLVPRAYVITPVQANAVVVTYGFNDGSVLFDATVPITGASGTINAPVLSYYHALDFFGHSANITASLPYAVGTFRATVNSVPTQIYRSGLLDAGFRFSANLIGGPAMTAREYSSWQQKNILGASLTVVTPTGQYDPARAVNQGSNRFSVKPELGYSRRKGHYVIDAYAGIWFFTTNHAYYTGQNSLSQRPIAAFEWHLSYDVKPRFWVSLDANYWVGGLTRVNAIENLGSLQSNSRVGATVSLPVTKHQAFKFSYSDGAHIRYGGNYHNVSAAWQYSWIGKPK